MKTLALTILLSAGIAGAYAQTGNTTGSLDLPTPSYMPSSSPTPDMSGMPDNTTGTQNYNNTGTNSSATTPAYVPPANTTTPGNQIYNPADPNNINNNNSNPVNPPPVYNNPSGIDPNSNGSNVIK